MCEMRECRSEEIMDPSPAVANIGCTFDPNFFVNLKSYNLYFFDLDFHCDLTGFKTVTTAVTTMH